MAEHREHDHHDEEHTEPGPRENTDDSTIADMGLTGRPATSATPVGQGDDEGTGAEDDEADER